MKKVLFSMLAMLAVCVLAAPAHAFMITLGTSQDAGVGKLYFSPATSSTNTGSAEWLGYYNYPTTGYYIQDSYGFFQFDLSGLSANNLASATFNAYQRTSDYYNSDPSDAILYTMKTYQLTSAWDEATVTYNTGQPTIGNVAGTVSFQAAAGIYKDAGWEYDGTVSTDITSLVSSWLNGSASNYGLAYKMDNVLFSNGHANMVGTKENTTAAFQPELVLVYAPSVPVPEPATVALLGIGLAGMGMYGVRRRRRHGYKES